MSLIFALCGRMIIPLREKIRSTACIRLQCPCNVSSLWLSYSVGLVLWSLFNM